MNCERAVHRESRGAAGREIRFSGGLGMYSKVGPVKGEILG